MEVTGTTKPILPRREGSATERRKAYTPPKPVSRNRGSNSQPDPPQSALERRKSYSRASPKSIFLKKIGLDISIDAIAASEGVVTERMFSDAIGVTIKKNPPKKETALWIKNINAGMDPSNKLWNTEEKSNITNYVLILQADPDDRETQLYTLFTVHYHGVLMRF